MSNHAPINFEALYRYNAGRMGRLPSLTKITLLLSACLALGGLPPFSPSAAAGVAAPTSRALLWPLEVPGALLSSFAEYRYDHLHAGIDISTGGRTGYKVRAAATGVIYRLKVEWRGYGRALYLRHPDGRVSVYGHLERYEEAVLHLERRVARRQSEAKTRYPGDIYLDPPIAVRRGQVIAFSGESGVGLPHLHFEVRDHDDAPIDPFAAGLRPPADRVRPVLESLTVTAASPQAFVDGVWRERTYPLTGRGGIETTADPVRIRGPFVASLSTYDPAGNGGRSGVGAVEMSIDGRMRYRFAPRSFRFDQYPESGLVFDHRGSRLGPAHFSYRLVRLPGNELAGGDLPVDGERAPEGYPGAIDLEPGPHLMEIVVGDAAGNTSRARIELRSDPTPEPRGPFGTAPEPGEVRVDFWPGFFDVLLADGGFPASPLILAAGASATPVLSFSERQGGGRWAALTYRRAAGLSPPLTIAPAEAGGTALATLSLDSRFVTPAETLIVQAPDCSVEIPRGGRFFPGPLVVRTTPTAGAPSLPAMADAVEILPEGEALNARGTLRFDVTQAILDPRPLGIYRWDAAGALWIYEGGDLDPSGRSIALPFHRYGRFALLQDASPPVIKEVIPAPGARAVPRRAPISARVEEEGEGLDYDGVTFLLDGAPLVSEFDPDRGRSQVLEPPLLSSGPHHLRVTATDRAGNSSEPVEVEFEVGPSRNR